MYIVHTPARSPSTYITPQVHTDRHTFLKEESSVHYGICPLFYYVCNVKKIAVKRWSKGVRQQLYSQRRCTGGGEHALLSTVLHPTWQKQTPVQVGEATKAPEPLFLSLKREKLIVSRALGNVLQSKQMKIHYSRF